MSIENALLRTSVISSSSSKSLRALMQEVRQVHGPDTAIDLFVPRPQDAREIGLQLDENTTPTELMASHGDEIRKWFSQTCAGMSIAALATYFPDVTSTDNRRRTPAVHALIHSVQLSLDLMRLNLMAVACVEAVCGNRLEPRAIETDLGTAVPHSLPWVVEYSLSSKLDRLCQSLREVVRKVKASKDYKGERFVIALELEPGEPYVLKDAKSIRDLTRRIEADQDLSEHVGLNLDIAHMMIAGIRASDLCPDGQTKAARTHGLNSVTQRIAHAHIADHPRMHTRDQPVGVWTHDTLYREYLQLLTRRANQARTDANALPFTGAVALELEGCSRMSWVHWSLAETKRLLDHAMRDDLTVKDARSDAEAVLNDLLAGKSDDDPNLAPLARKIKGFQSYAIETQNIDSDNPKAVKFNGTLIGPQIEATFVSWMVKQPNGRWMISHFQGPNPK